MDRSGQRRTLIFCHQCENDWYRDEHGLECPTCHSEFTEIIDDVNDPRNGRRASNAERGADGSAGAAADVEPLVTDSNLVDDGGARREDGRHRRHPGLTLGPQDLDVEAPDPPEGQINRFEWTSSGPSGFTVRASTQPVPALPVGPGPYADLPLMNDFVTMLNGIRGAPESGQRDGAEQTGVRTEWNDNARFNTVTRHGGGPTYTYTTTARLYPTDPGQPLTAGQTTAAIPTLIGQLFGGVLGHINAANAGTPGGPPPEMAALLSSMFNPANAAHGDAVYTQEALDRIVSQLMEQHGSGGAPGPASAQAIAALPTRPVVQQMLGENGRAECSICMDDVALGATVTSLPCAHWFHGPCIEAWLREHDTCPHCRKSITASREGTNPNPNNINNNNNNINTDNNNVNVNPNTNLNPIININTTSNFDGSSASGSPHRAGFAGSGTRRDPFVLQEGSSRTGRRRQSGSGDAGGGGLSGAIRNIFRSG